MMNVLAALARWIIALIIAVSVLFLLLTAEAARAQALQCAAFDQVMSVLDERYGEQLIGEGKGPNGTKLLLFAHPDGDTWTVIGVLPDGQACWIASGAEWAVHEFTPAGLEI